MIHFFDGIKLSFEKFFSSQNFGRLVASLIFGLLHIFKADVIIIVNLIIGFLIGKRTLSLFAKP